MDLALFYVGIPLFLIGIWQVSRRGPHAGVIGGTLAIFLLGAGLLFGVNRHLGGFVLFVFASWFLLMQLFRYASYRKYFFHVVPFVILYAVGTAYLLRQLEFKDFFWWYLPLTALFLTVNLVRQLKTRDAVAAFAELDRTVADAMPEGMVRKSVEKELSTGSTVRQYVVSTVAVFAAVFALAFYLFFGGI